MKLRRRVRLLAIAEAGRSMSCNAPGRACCAGRLALGGGMREVAEMTTTTTNGGGFTLVPAASVNSLPPVTGVSVQSLAEGAPRRGDWRRPGAEAGGTHLAGTRAGGDA